MGNKTAILPNFLYIGAAKAGSSWLYESLRGHPDVFIPMAKDLQFFDREYERGMEWYLSFFITGKGKKAIGELSHNYFLEQEAAVRIQQHLPNVRLICCLREPIERTFSEYLFCRTIRLHPTVSFAEFAFEERRLKMSDYYYNLRPFYERFPTHHILVLFFDELKNNPQLFIKTVYEFLGIDADYSPGHLLTKILPASNARAFWLTHFAYNSGKILRALGMPNIVGMVKRNRVFRTVLFKPLDQKPAIPDEIKQQLREYYQKRYQLLPGLIGRSLPPTWFKE